jgi:hypothetical protein
MLVRALITGVSIVEIAVGFSMGGSPLIHPGSGAGDIMIFIGAVLLGGFWSLAWCNWYSATTVRQLQADEGREGNGVADRPQVVGS